MDLISPEQMRDEIELAQHARDFFRSLRCSRRSAKITLCTLAGREELSYQRRLDALNAALAKLPKPEVS